MPANRLQPNLGVPDVPSHVFLAYLEEGRIARAKQRLGTCAEVVICLPLPRPGVVGTAK